METERHSKRHRAVHKLGGVVADAAYASVLAVPVALGVAVYTFVYLSFLRRRLRRSARAEDSTD